MKVEVYTKSKIELDIDGEEAFRMLCKALNMECVLTNCGELYIGKNSDGENRVCYIKNGYEEVYDDRGDLFIALSNVAVQIFPNCDIRSEDYIYHY